MSAYTYYEIDGICTSPISRRRSRKSLRRRITNASDGVGTRVRQVTRRQLFTPHAPRRPSPTRSVRPVLYHKKPQTPPQTVRHRIIDFQDTPEVIEITPNCRLHSEFQSPIVISPVPLRRPRLIRSSTPKRMSQYIDISKYKAYSIDNLSLSSCKTSSSRSSSSTSTASSYQSFDQPELWNTEGNHSFYFNSTLPAHLAFQGNVSKGRTLLKRVWKVLRRK